MCIYLVRTNYALLKQILMMCLPLAFACAPTSPQFTGSTQEFESIDKQIQKNITPYQIDDQADDEITKVQLPKFKREEKTKHFQLHHTQLQVSFDWQKQYMNGMATLTLSPYLYPQDSIVLDAKGFSIHEVNLLENNKSTKLRYQYDQKKLRLYLPETRTQKDTFQVFIKYTAKPNELQETVGKAIKSDKGLFFINPLGKEPKKPKQIWTQGETEYSSCWFPTFDSPNVKTSQEIWIEVDNAYKTLSNGKLISSTPAPNNKRIDYWKQKLPHAPYLFMMAIGDFAVIKDEVDGLPLSYYFEPQFEEEGKEVFKNTPEMVRHFGKLFDYPFPWDKYAQIVVRDYVSGAMENTSASIFMQEVIIDKRELLDRNWDDIIAHELMHQWFGDVVTTESWSNLPLNESFATYSEYLWREFKNGKYDADTHWLDNWNSYSREAENKNEDLIRYYYNDKEDMFDSHSYAKGSLILHRLRKVVGDTAFFKSLSLYLKTNEFQAAEDDHLRLAFEKVTGRDLQWFFDQWFHAPGHPVLTVTDSFEGQTVTVNIGQDNSVKNDITYKIPIHIDLWYGDTKKSYFKVIDELVEEFTFPSEQAPDLVIVGADDDLPGEINHLKTTEEFILQFKRYNSFLTQLETIEEFSQDLENSEIQNFMAGLLNHKFWFYRDAAVNYFTAIQQQNGDDKYEDKIVELAKKDEKTQVRSSAIRYLNPMIHTELLEKFLQDRSYNVVTTALLQMMRLRREMLADEVAKFENIHNVNLTVLLMNYYVQLKIPNKADWFIDKMLDLSIGTKQYLIELVNEYAKTQGGEQKEKILTFYKEQIKYVQGKELKEKLEAGIEYVNGNDDK